MVALFVSQKYSVMEKFNYNGRTFFSFSFFLSYLGWHTLPLHASAEACLTGWPNAQAHGRD